MERIAVVGSSGSGKTTVSRHLAADLDLPHLELDSVFHQENWTPLPTDEMKARVARFVAADRWVVDGNYPVVSAIIWQRADTVVWLDLSRLRVMSRLVPRTLGRGLQRTELWNGNREELRNVFRRDPDKNLLLWTWTKHRGLRERYEQAAAGADHLSVFRLRSPSAVERFLAGTDR